MSDWEIVENKSSPKDEWELSDSSQSAMPSQNPSLINRISQHPITQGILGAGDALRNQILEASRQGLSPEQLSLINPMAKNIQKTSPSGEGAAYNVGTYIPDLIGIGGLAKTGIKGGIKGLSYAFRPNFYKNQLIKELLNGATNSKEISRSLASDVRNKFSSLKAEAGKYYNPVLEKHGESNIFHEQRYAEVPNAKYSSKVPEINEVDFSGDTKDLVKDFKSKPNLKNAHELQQKLGQEIGDLKKMPRTSETRREKNKLTSLRNKVNKGINNFLESTDKNAYENWQKGKRFYKKNIAPYSDYSPLRKIAEGQKRSPKNIHNIFTNLEDDQLSSILSHHPENFMNKILGSKIKGYNENLSPNKISSLIDSARTEGFGEFVSPRINQLLNKIETSERNKRYAKTGAFGGATLIGLDKVKNSLLDNIKESSQEF